MSAASRTRDKEAAAHLRSRGIFHGRRLTSGLSNIPSMSDIGSAAYRRLMAKTTASNVARNAKPR